MAKNIALIGFMGTGKSSVGKELAKKLGREHVDIDALIEKVQKKKVAEIFEGPGEAAFRRLEKETILSVSRREGLVITTGGGAVLDPQNLAALREKGVVICLAASPETIFKRVKHSPHRPLLLGEDRLGQIRRLLETRRPFYSQSDGLFETDGLTPSQVAVSILEFLKEKHWE